MKKKILLLALAIIAFVLIDTLIIDGYSNKNVDNAQLAKVLTEQCDCSNVENGINGTGLSFPDAVYGDYHNFRLSNCEFTDLVEFGSLAIYNGFYKRLFALHLLYPPT